MEIKATKVENTTQALEFQNSIEIQVPVSGVFEYVTDMRNLPQWNYDVTRVVQERGTSPAPGACYLQTQNTDDQRYEISHFEPGKSLTIQALPNSKPVFEREMRFEAVVNGTRLTDQWSIHKCPDILDRWAMGTMSAAIAENLGKLKELLETGRTELQNGRISRVASLSGLPPTAG